jgi:hypothetical protein
VEAGVNRRRYPASDFLDFVTLFSAVTEAMIGPGPRLGRTPSLRRPTRVNDAQSGNA